MLFRFEFVDSVCFSRFLFLDGEIGNRAPISFHFRFAPCGVRDLLGIPQLAPKLPILLIPKYYVGMCSGIRENFDLF